jgi:hypothetical protein
MNHRHAKAGRGIIDLVVDAWTARSATTAERELRPRAGRLRQSVNDPNKLRVVRIAFISAASRARARKLRAE